MSKLALASNWEVLSTYLDAMKASIQTVLPEGMDADRFKKIVVTCYNRTPKLAECTLESIARVVMQSAELGLEIGGTLGEAYMLPYHDRRRDVSEAQLIIGYQGYLKLARNSGMISHVTANIVYENDIFTFDLARNDVSHRIDTETMKAKGGRGAPILAYCIVHQFDGRTPLTVMTWDDIMGIAKRSKSYYAPKDEFSGPWKTDREEMARKTVVRRGLKYADRSIVRLAKAFEYDKELRDEETAEGGNLPALPEQVSRAQRFLGRLGPLAPVTPTPVAAAAAIDAQHYELPTNPDLATLDDEKDEP